MTGSIILVVCPAGLEGVELLHAVDTRHYFPKHFHDTYRIPVQERGAMVSLYRNRRDRRVRPDRRRHRSGEQRSDDRDRGSEEDARP